MANDAYIRLGSGGVRSFGQPQHHDSVLFVDVAPGRELADLRNAEPGIFRDVRVILARADHPADSPPSLPVEVSARLTELREQLIKLELPNVACGVLYQPVGADAFVEGDVPDVDGVLERARAVELEALLEWGSAVWRPATYHYRLPSGEHAAAFVRLADAIRKPRDAEVLASWMHRDLSDRIGLVFDTGTVSAVAQALIAALRAQGWRPGAVNVLDGYPATDVDVSQAIAEASREAGVIVVLTVNSSGRVRDRVVSALGQVAGDRVRSVHVLLSKRPVDAQFLGTGGIDVRTWHPLVGDPPLIEYGIEGAESCELCRNAATALLIPVDPGSFDGRVPASVHRIVLNVTDAHRNRELWQHANATVSEPGAITLDGEPREGSFRPRGEMAFVVDIAAMLSSRDFRTDAVSRMQDLMRERRMSSIDADVLLVPEHEANVEGTAELIAAMQPMIGKPEVLAFPPREEWTQGLKDKVAGAADAVAVLVLGSVSGTGLQNALAAVQGARKPGGYELRAFVVHARPPERRGWRTLENSYAHKLVYAWHTYLPDRSPLEDERQTLSGLHPADHDALSPDAQDFVAARRRFSSTSLEDSNEMPELENAHGLFWGSAPGTQVTPDSLFGQGLRGVAVYTAVASAMERARKEALASAAPLRRVFEMPAIARSYYDPMILAAVLRWLQPHEAWWGNQFSDQTNMVQAILARATAAQLPILLAEMLLASAQGKINAPGARVLRAAAESRMDSEPPLPKYQRAALEVAVKLVAAPETDDESIRRRSSTSTAIASCTTETELLDLVPNILKDLRQGRLPDHVSAELARRIGEIRSESASNPQA